MISEPFNPAVLMCRPDSFAVEYVINPWMEGHVGRTRREVARRQWDQLYAEVEARTRVELVPPGRQLPDMCFTANAGLVVGNRVIISAFRFPQRRGEEALFSEWFEQHGYEVLRTVDDEAFEGEGDGLVQPGQPLLWAAYGVRTSLEAHRSLSALLDLEVVALRLVDERFYHLDTCLYPLPEGRLVYYPQAFDEHSLREIALRIPENRRIEVGESDALRFACNSLRLGDTIITNHVSPVLRHQLKAWGFEVLVCPVDEFLLSGGAVKCLCLQLDQDLGDQPPARENVESQIRSTRLSIHGHLLDSGILNQAIDIVTDGGGSCRVEQLDAAERRDQTSTAVLRVTAPNEERLEVVVGQLLGRGWNTAEPLADVQLERVTQQGVAPASFYATTIYPTDVRVAGEWIRVSEQRMDAVIVVETPTDSLAITARCRLLRNLRIDDQVVCGVAGVRVDAPTHRNAAGDEFSFMSAGVSTERRVELSADSLAWEMRRIRSRGGKTVVVAGPVVVHTGGSRYLVKLIEQGYVQMLLSGNALPVHDIELNLFGTSLGVDLNHGSGTLGGHTHHLRAINAVRAAGSIANAVRDGIITGGIMHACVRHQVPFVLAGSIRDDGPLPDTLMDLVQAQAEYSTAIQGADMVLMLSSMLHSIGTGNMTPAGVRMICVDINPSVVTKLTDRGSMEATGIVTDVGLFLNLLAEHLADDPAEK